MSKAPKEKLTIQELLDKEKAKTRRIVTAVVFAAGILTGTIAGHFGSVAITNDMRQNFTEEVQTLSKVKQ